MGIKIKRSAVEGKVPVVADLEIGQLAMNTADGKLYLKRSIGGVESIVQVGGVTSVAGRGGAVTLTISDVALLQAALDSKAAEIHDHIAAEIVDSSAAGRALLVATDVAAQRASLGLATGAFRNVAVGTTAPTSPAVADLWVDTN